MFLLLSVMLSAAPAGPTQLVIEVSPEDTQVFIDGKKKGTGAKTITATVTPGRHTIKVSRKGEGHEEDVDVKKGEKKTWKWAFEGSPPPKPKDEPKPEKGKDKETQTEEKKDSDLSLEKL